MERQSEGSILNPPSMVSDYAHPSQSWALSLGITLVCWLGTDMDQRIALYITLFTLNRIPMWSCES